MAIFNFLRRPIRGVLSFANRLRDGVTGGLRMIKRLPVIGEVVSAAAKAPIPGLGASAEQIANTASRVLDKANEIDRLARQRRRGARALDAPD